MRPVSVIQPYRVDARKRIWPHACARKFRILTIIDEASRECLALIVARQLKHEDVLVALADLFVTRVPPAHIRSDNGAEFIANAVQNGSARSA